MRPHRGQTRESRKIGQGTTDISGETSDQGLEVSRVAHFRRCSIADFRYHSSG